jgi:hypothetical protein
MSKIGKTLFQQGTTSVTRKCMASSEKLIEHSRTSARKGKKEQSAYSVMPKLCGVEAQRNAEIVPEEPVRPHN